jgi:hypothetical protein
MGVRMRRRLQVQRNAFRSLETLRQTHSDTKHSNTKDKITFWTRHVFRRHRRIEGVLINGFEENKEERDAHKVHHKHSWMISFENIVIGIDEG